MSSAGRPPSSTAERMSIAAAMRAPGVTRPRYPGSHILPVVRRLAGDRDVVHVRFAQTRAGDSYKRAVLLHLGDRAVAGVSHRRFEPADQLVDDVADRALVRHAALDPLGTELQGVCDLLLEIAVGGAARHRPDRSHAAIIFVAAALVEKDFARALVGPGEEGAEHRAIGAGGDSLRQIAGEFDPAVGDDRDIVPSALFDRIR